MIHLQYIENNLLYVVRMLQAARALMPTMRNPRMISVLLVRSRNQQSGNWNTRLTDWKN